MLRGLAFLEALTSNFSRVLACRSGVVEVEVEASTSLRFVIAVLANIEDDLSVISRHVRLVLVAITLLPGAYE
jgi:hypothetical protein